MKNTTLLALFLLAVAPFAMRSILALAVLLASSAVVALAQGTYTRIDVPLAYDTSCSGIDTAGDIVGTYDGPEFFPYGFVLSNGAYSLVDFPKEEYNILYGINDHSRVVGFGIVPGNVAYLFNVATQTFTRIKDPHHYTRAFAINNSGTVAGEINIGSGYAGFELIGSTYKTILPPGAAQARVTGITDGNAMVGNVIDSQGFTVSNFSYVNGQYYTLTIPNAPNAVVTGVNPAGTAVVGYYSPRPQVTRGFVFQNGVTTTLHVPESTVDYAYGINASGVVVGEYYDASGITHGFVWTPDAPVQEKSER